MKPPGDPASPLSWLGDGLTQCASHVRQSPLCVLPIGCPQAWFIIPESRRASPLNNDGSVAESSECKETGPALVGRPVPSHLPLDAASRSDEHLTDVMPVDAVAHGVPPWNLTTGEEFDPTLGTVQFLDPVTDLLGFLGN